MRISDWSSDVCSSDLSARVVIAWDGEAPCGFSAVRIAGPESELLLLAVDPARRGQGIGRRLLADWQGWAAAEGAQDFFLEMRADNDAIHLYRRAGFAECGRRAAYYRGGDGKMRDAITMRWRSEEHTSEIQSIMRISYA